MYKGYGYWEYDSDELNMVIREGEQYMKSCLFMLPEDAEKEILHKGEAIVSYLLMSKDSDINEPLYNYPCTDDEPRFVLCNDDPIFENGYQQLREQKTVKYVREDIIPKLLSDDESKKQIIEPELEKIDCKQINAKPRKKLLPHLRETNSALMLLYELFGHYKVRYLDELKAVTAWGRIVSKEFKSEHIDSIADTKKSITLIDNVKLTKEDFLEKYRKRFKY
jgi:hypothetical protein